MKLTAQATVLGVSMLAAALWVAFSPLLAQSPARPAPMHVHHVRMNSIASGSVLFDDTSISIRPWPGGGLVSTRGHIVDHRGLSVADLGPAVTRLKSEGVKVLEEIHAWGATQAAMIEGPDRVAIELVELR